MNTTPIPAGADLPQGAPADSLHLDVLAAHAAGYKLGLMQVDRPAAVPAGLSATARSGVVEVCPDCDIADCFRIRARRASGATAAAGVPALLNQCDGCAVSPAVNRFGNHDMPDGSKMACTAHRYRAPLAAQTATQPASDAVARVDSFTNGSYSRNYKLTWLKDVAEGTLLYTPAQPAPAPGAGKGEL